MVRSTCLSIRVTSKGINIFVTFLLKRKVPGPANRSSIGKLSSAFGWYRYSAINITWNQIHPWLSSLRDDFLCIFFILLTMTLFTARPRAHLSSYIIMVRTNGSFKNFCWSSSNTRSAGLQFSISLDCVVPDHLKLHKRENLLAAMIPSIMWADPLSIRNFLSTFFNYLQLFVLRTDGWKTILVPLPLKQRNNSRLP